MRTPRPITGPWTLRQFHHGDVGQPRHGLRVFSTFSCGGGSSMGYKLAGFDVVGCCEIDPEMMETYRTNLSPRHPYLMPIQEFNKIPVDRLPPELMELDVLDGSPPCSVFSMAGNREKDWGVERQFREGQAEQRLDDLFFHFIETARRLQPKVVVAENVTGMLRGNARGYVKEIFAQFRGAGYDPQLFKLNAADMGVPQARERVFFICRRSDLGLPTFEMDFSEPKIILKKAIDGLRADDESLLLGAETAIRRLWMKTVPGNTLETAAGKGQHFTNIRLSYNKVAPTMACSSWYLHPTEPRVFSDLENCRIQTFPDDYRFPPGRRKSQYVCGMSVPPLMMQRIALRIASGLLEP